MITTQEIPYKLQIQENRIYMDLNIGKLLRLLEEERIKQGISQEEMGGVIGVGGRQYINLVTTSSKMNLYQFNLLCKRLDISAVSLISKSSIEQSSKEEINKFLDQMIDFVNRLKSDINEES